MSRRSSRISSLTARQTIQQDEKFEYVNWMDSEWISMNKQHNQSSSTDDNDARLNVTKWEKFIARIGKDKLKRYKCNQQIGNSCVVFVSMHEKFNMM